MHVHFLGICGTFMASLSLLAKEQGYVVTGQDSKVYPPMSTQLAENQIEIEEGFAINAAVNAADIVVVGNIMRRGMPVVEHLLANKRELISGPEFLAKHILLPKKMHTLVVSGTHGKTTTTSMLAWILEKAGLQPGYLIGGIPNNFNKSAALGAGKYFVVEGDEYDSAFFDKRSKFVHYRPDTLIINNLEFDHADIFKDLIAIQTQFHHMLRVIPVKGKVIIPAEDQNINELINWGCWSQLESFAEANKASEVGKQIIETPQVASNENGEQGNEAIVQKHWSLAGVEVNQWPFFGKYNYLNALAAIAAANDVGVEVEVAIEALRSFTGVKRRLELLGKVSGVSVYADFAHHPTAIKLTLAAIKEMAAGQGKIIAVVDVCSNTMRSGLHKDTLATAVSGADKVYFYNAKEVAWDIAKLGENLSNYGGVYQQSEALINVFLKDVKAGDYLVLMSNGAFSKFHSEILSAIEQAQLAV